MSAFQQSFDRQIPSLRVLCLKTISKDPAHHIDPERLQRANCMFNTDQGKSFDFAQELVNFLTEAGRFVDDALPPSLFVVNDIGAAPRTSLSLSNSKVTAEYICRVLDACGKHLDVLDLSGCFQTSDASIADLCIKCPRLAVLNLRNCRKLTDLGLENIVAASTASSRKRARRQGGMDIEGVSVAVSVGEGGGEGDGCLSELHTLHLGGVTNLSERGIISFINSFPRFPTLVDLNLSGTRVSDATLQAIGLRNTNLRRFSMAYSDVSEAALRKVLEQIGRKLELLNISWVGTTAKNSPLTVDFFIDFLPTRCTALEDLDVTGLRHVTIPSLAQYLDTAKLIADKHPKDARVPRTIRCRYVSSPKALIDQQLVGAYPLVKFVS